MTSTLELPEIAIIPGQQNRPELYRRPQSIVADGLHQESKISLYVLAYNGNIQASTFIYPASYILSSEIIEQLDAFTNISDLIITREFKDFSMEELSVLLLREAKPLIPFMNHEYNFEKRRIMEHSFQKDSQVYLENVIKSLKK
jgi:hypothetical protein